MSSNFNVTFVKQLVKLLKQYEKKDLLSPNEFIITKAEEDPTSISPEVAKMFLTLLKHELIFGEILETICEKNKLGRENKWLGQVLLCLVVFYLDENNHGQVIGICKNIKQKVALCVVEFFACEENLILATKISCKYFDNSYVLGNFLNPLIQKAHLIEVVHKEVSEHLKRKLAIIPKELTTPVEPSFMKRLKRKTFSRKDETVVKFKARKVTRYKNDVSKIEENLAKEKDKNWLNALKLLEQARKTQIKCVNKPKYHEEEAREIKPICATKLPTFSKEVQVKRTTASLMREAAILSSDRESELKRLEDLLSGGYDQSKIVDLEKSILNEKQQQRVQDVERKHLLGLLTFEEAILAKRKLTEVNKRKMEVFKTEKMKILNEINEWKHKEQIKIDLLVEKIRTIEKSAKEAEKRMVEDKRSCARLMNYESRQMLLEVSRKRQRDLAEKVKLIQELRALEHMRLSGVKEFDPTDGPNFGLLCEMSIAELRERLGLLKLEMREELARRRRIIVEERRRKEQLVDDIRDFVSQLRMSKPKPVPNAPAEVEPSPDIVALREKLQQARNVRMNKADRGDVPVLL